MIYNINELNKSLNDYKLSNIYLLYGEEEYLKECYKKDIIEAVRAYEGEDTEIVRSDGNIRSDKLYELVDTSSFFSSSKMVIIKNSGWFKNESGDIFDKYGFLTEPHEGLYVIFIEENIAKNRKMYKSVEKNGVCTEFAMQSSDMKERWISARFKEKGFIADRTVCSYMANNCEANLWNIKNEVDKICLLKKPGDKITVSDVDSVCIKIINSKIFALTDNINSGNTEKALKVFYDLVGAGEPVERIYFMVCRFFRLMRQAKELVKSGESAAAASIMGINPYEASQFIKNSGKYSMNGLKTAEFDCLAFDVARKNGEMDYDMAIEMILIKYCGRKNN